MKVTYDPDVDVLRIVFRDVAFEESDEDKPGVTLHFDREGNIVGMEPSWAPAPESVSGI